MTYKARRFLQLPDLPSNHILNACRGWLSVIKPIARTNMITNPSFETATTNYTAVGGSIARSTTQQYHGAYSLAVTPTAATTDGVFYGTVSLTSGTTYAASCKFYGVAGVPYKISFATTGGVDLTAYRFTGTGRWQWVYVYYTETSTTTRRIYFTKNTSTSTGIFYIDGVQVESLTAGETVSTYIDGDQQSLIAAQFPPPYQWTGTRHASTSTRSAQTRDGGMVFNFDAYKFFVTAIAGLGMVDPSHITADVPLVDGTVYQTSLLPARAFTVTGRFNTTSDFDLDKQRTALAAALNLDATAPRQPVALLYQKYNGFTPTSDTGKIIASYTGGLGGQWDNVVGETPAVGFSQWFPLVTSNDQGAALTQSTSVASFAVGGNLAYRTPAGVWSLLDSGGGSVLAIDVAADGTFVVAGAFTTIGGTSANSIARYNPITNTFSAFGTGITGGGASVHAVKIARDGKIFVTGDFTTAGGGAAANVAFWDGAAWNAMTTGLNAATGRAITFDASGNTYIAGDFTLAGGVANTVRIAKWDGAAWSALGTGLNNFANCLATGLDGTSIYVSGTFTTANGVTCTRIAKWNGTTFEPLSTGLSAAASEGSLIIAPDGSLFAGGAFVTAGGLTVNGITRWNGTIFSALSTGVAGSTATVLSLMLGTDGLLYLGGVFTSAGGISLADSFAEWNGSSYILPDVDFPGAAGSANVVAMRMNQAGGFMISPALTSNGSAVTAAVNTLTNDGAAAAYPIIRITGPSSSTSRLHQIRSYTTNAIISFNLTIFANEEITITTGPGIVTATSNIKGDLTQYILSGSAPEFALLPGANSVAILVTGGTVTATATWQKRYQDTSGLAYT